MKSTFIFGVISRWPLLWLNDWKKALRSYQSLITIHFLCEIIISRFYSKPVKKMKIAGQLKIFYEDFNPEAAVL